MFSFQYTLHFIFEDQYFPIHKKLIKEKPWVRSHGLCIRMVRMKGLEPPCRKALDPKSSASANFATSACALLL